MFSDKNADIRNIKHYIFIVFPELCPLLIKQYAQMQVEPDKQRRKQIKQTAYISLRNSNSILNFDQAAVYLHVALRMPSLSILDIIYS
jgi:hypothetical protein